MPTSLGPAEILVILVVALIVLGPKRLPEAGRQVGKAIAEVRRWSQGFQDEIRSAVDYDPGRPSYPAPPPSTEAPSAPTVTDVTGPPAEVGAAPPPAADRNGSGAAPRPAEPGLASTDPAPPDPSGPPAGEPPRA